jgi:hypothetical protein
MNSTMTSKLKHVLVIGSLILCGARVASAQTEGRISVGGSVVFAKPTDSELNSAVSGGPLVRLNPRKGWGPAGALNWMRLDIDDPTGGSGDFARLRVRPLMAGVAYTIGDQPLLVSFSIVAGPSFNKLILDDDFVGRVPAAQVDAETSFAVRPGVGLTLTVAPRVAIVGFGGYIVNRPDLVYRDGGQQFTNRWKADSIVLSVGAVYSLF